MYLRIPYFSLDLADEKGMYEQDMLPGDGVCGVLSWLGSAYG